MSEPTTTERGRQGERRPMALRTLIISTGLMLVALIGLMLWNYVDAPTSYPAKGDAAARQERDGGTARPVTGVPGGNPSYPAPAVKDANR